MQSVIDKRSESITNLNATPGNKAIIEYNLYCYLSLDNYSKLMDPSQIIIDNRGDSPDPSSHTMNIYEPEGEWLDEEDDDDMDFEPITDDSEDAEFFDPSEDPEAEFQGIDILATILYCSCIHHRFLLTLSPRSRR